MALTKPPVLPPWADSGDKVQPSDVEIQAGWPLSNVPPSRQRFNWLLNFLSNGIRYLTRRGMPDYAADETYMTGDRIIGDDGKTYRSIQDTNLNHTPSSSPLWWERWGFGASELSTELNKLDYKTSCRVATTANLAALSGLLTIDGVVLVAGDRVLVKNQTTASQNGIYVAAAGAWARAADADDGTKLSPGASIPVETGTANADTIWRLSTDGVITIGTTAIAFARDVAFSEFGASLAASGYQKLPGGLIIQWGVHIATAATGTVTFPITFPNATFIVVATDTQSTPTSVATISTVPGPLGSFDFAAAQGATAVVPGQFVWYALGN